MKALIFAAALAVAAPATVPATVHDLAWMAGNRVASDSSHEVWLDGGDMLVGSSVTVKGGKTVEFEFLRVGLTADKHVAYFASPSGRPPVPFVLKSLTGKRAVFENLGHDFPQRIIYWGAGNASVGARIEGTIGGKLQSQEWLFKPVR